MNNLARNTEYSWHVCLNVRILVFWRFVMLIIAILYWCKHTYTRTQSYTRNYTSFYLDFFFKSLKLNCTKLFMLNICSTNHNTHRDQSTQLKLSFMLPIWALNGPVKRGIFLSWVLSMIETIRSIDAFYETCFEVPLRSVCFMNLTQISARSSANSQRHKNLAFGSSSFEQTLHVHFIVL